MLKFLLKILIVCVQSVHSKLYQDKDLTDSGIFSLFQTAYDIHCWVGKSASSKLYKRGLYNAIALDDAVITFMLSSVFIHFPPQCRLKWVAVIPVHIFAHEKVISFGKIPECCLQAETKFNKLCNRNGLWNYQESFRLLSVVCKGTQVPREPVAFLHPW